MSGIIFSENSGVVNSIFGKSQDPIKMFLEKRAEAFEKESIADKIFNKEKSTNYAEKYTSMSSMDSFMPVPEGGAYPRTSMQEGPAKTIENVTWKNSFVITQEIVEDAKLMDLRKKPDAFITSFYRTKEQYAAAMLAGGILNTTVNFGGKVFDTKAADGKALFANDHTSAVKGKAQANVFSDATFTYTTLSKAETKMQNFRDDNDNILGLTPDTIIIPNDATAKKAVFEVIGADKDPATSNNAFNYQYGRWNVIVWPYLNQYLGNTVPYILMDSKYNKTTDGAVWQERIPLSVDSYIDPNTDDNVWKGRARFAAGFTDWRAFLAFGVTSATNSL